MRLSLPAAVITTMISAMPTMETMGMALSSQLNLPFSRALKTNPAAMGTITILMMSITMAITSTSMN